jgi:multimeric flavodoxin WrbA
MKVTVINGTARHGSTWHCKQQFLQELSKYGEVETTEFTLPRDMPVFCKGCFSCFYNGEDTCPDAKYTMPIVNALKAADIIVFTSPIYAMDVSGQMKALLDHLCFMWVSHRPDPAMFKKAGVIFSTTAGSGLGHASKTMKNTLDFWGVKRTFVFKKMVAAMKWDDVSDKNKERIKTKTAALAKKAAAAAGKKNIRPRIFFRLFFTAMRVAQKKNDWNPKDRAHWQAHGWLDGTDAFKG